METGTGKIQRPYEMPRMTVVELQHRAAVLVQTSNGDATVQNYNWHNETEE